MIYIFGVQIVKTEQIKFKKCPAELRIYLRLWIRYIVRVSLRAATQRKVDK